MFLRRIAISSLLKLLTFFTIGLTLISCLKKESISIIPQISYQSIALQYDSALYPSRGFLTLSFQDGDGDIGLFPDQNNPPFNEGSIYHYNFYVEYFEKRDGHFYQLDLGDPGMNGRIPYLTPDDPNKAIKGIIVDTLPMPAKPQHDTIKLRFYIYDRSLHKSNIDSTPPIILRRP